MIKVFLSALLLLGVLQPQADGFVVKPQLARARIIDQQHPLISGPGSIGSTQLFLSDNNKGDKPERIYDDGTARGIPLLGLSLLICVWFFTIPPEFRRNHWCFSDRCTQDPTAVLCYDCVTFGAWKNDIVDYYKNGGGIQWDFSIDPNSPFLLENMKD